jgi:hypothetical protein
MPLATGAGCPRTGRFQCPQVCICIKGGAFAKQNWLRGLPAPPVPPCPGFRRGRSAEGLTSTRTWPFRWALTPTSPPQVIPKPMRACQLAGAVILGAELRQRPHAHAARGALLPFECLRKNARCPGPPELLRKA